MLVSLDLLILCICVHSWMILDDKDFHSFVLDDFRDV